MQQAVTVTDRVIAAHDEFLGHPKGLYVCFATELWERFSFYGMKYLLLLYLTKYHLFTDSAGLDVLGAYAGLVYALPVIGGLLADRYLGMRKAVVFGGILLSLGHLTMAYEGVQAVEYAAGTVLSSDLTLANGNVLAAGTLLSNTITIQDTAALKVFYFALALIVMGVGFLKPNISTIVGQLYAKDDARRDSGFTIFYMGINIGSFAATILCGWLGETFGWNYGFGAAGIGMILGLVTFLWGQKFLYGAADPHDPAVLKERVFGFVNRELLIYLGGILALGLVWFLVQSEPVVHATQNIFLIISIISLILYAMFFHQPDADKTVGRAIAYITMTAGVIGVLLEIPFDYLQSVLSPGFLSVIAPFYAMSAHAEWFVYAAIIALIAFIVYGFLQQHSKEYSQMVVLMVLILSTVVFWALFEQSAGSMTLYADRVVDRNMFGWEARASQLGSLNPLFIIGLAPVFASMWIWLARRKLEPSTPIKFGLGILQAGLGFGALVLGAQFPDAAGKVALIWLVLAYLLHTTGELCLSPVGLSAVTKLSIPNVVSMSMGVWFLATALSETVATRIGKLAAIDTSGGETSDIATALATYTELFQVLMWLGLGVGAFVLIISPLLRRGMHDVH